MNLFFTVSSRGSILYVLSPGRFYPVGSGGLFTGCRTAASSKDPLRCSRQGAYSRFAAQRPWPYTKICKPAIHCADALREVFRRKGYPFYVDSPSNQIFVIMEDEKFRHLQEYVVCRFWKKMDAAHTVVRFVTSWATTMEDVRQLELVLENS